MGPWPETMQTLALVAAASVIVLFIRQTPKEFLELGQAVGASRAQMCWKIRLPFATPSIMVVIAAIIATVV